MGHAQYLAGSATHLVFSRVIHCALSSRAQDDPVISVVIGDYHYIALTARGSLYSWGRYCCGALGLGDPRVLEVGSPGGFPSSWEREGALAGLPSLPADSQEVEVPTEIRWDWQADELRGPQRKRLCFGVGAGGWHAGALVLEVDKDIDDEQARSQGKHTLSSPASPRT